MARVPLRATAHVKLDGSGNGTAKVGPLSAREVWYPSNVHVSVSSSVKESVCSIYVGSDTGQNNFRDESVFASSGDSSGTVGADVVKTGMYIWGIWTNGDANAQATITITGTRDV